MSRLTPEREVDIRLRVEQATFVNVYDAELLLSEIDALRRERDEAIVGAYRAAADVVSPHNTLTDDEIVTAILALAPQSALDAVERREREIRLAEQRAYGGHMHNCYYCTGLGDKKCNCGYEKRIAELTADDVLAKVKRA